MKEISSVLGRTPCTRAAILEDLEHIVREMENNRLYFNMTDDEDLMDALIYEYNALLARRRYLLRQAQAEGVHAGEALGGARKGRLDKCLTQSVSADF